MLTEAQRQRFRALQQKEDLGTLSPAEQAELQAFVRLVEDAEAASLRPATDSLRQERLRLEKQNEALQTLVRRKERLARRLERVLALSGSEREQINAQVAAVLNPGSGGAAK
jgi:hypothetical protein